MRVVLDTWVFLDPSKFSKAILNRIRRKTLDGVISTITYAEIYSLLYKRVDDEEIQRFRQSLDRLSLRDVPVTKKIAEEGGRYKAKYGFSVADGIILATAVAENVNLLVTGDPDIERVKEIRVASPKKMLKEL